MSGNYGNDQAVKHEAICCRELTINGANCNSLKLSDKYAGAPRGLMADALKASELTSFPKDRIFHCPFNAVGTREKNGGSGKPVMTPLPFGMGSFIIYESYIPGSKTVVLTP